jgi:hypothetical protein
MSFTDSFFLSCCVVAIGYVAWLIITGIFEAISTFIYMAKERVLDKKRNIYKAQYYNDFMKFMANRK